MPRIRLSNWYGDKAPGDEIDVDDATLKGLRRDGRVAEVVETSSYDNGGVLEPGPSVATNEAGQPEAVESSAPSPEGRKRR